MHSTPQSPALFKVEFLQGRGIILQLEGNPCSCTKHLAIFTHETYLSCVTEMLSPLFYSHSLTHDKKHTSEMCTVAGVHRCGERLVLNCSTVTVPTVTEGGGCVPEMGHCCCGALSHLQIPLGTGFFSLRHIISECFF